MEWGRGNKKNVECVHICDPFSQLSLKLAPAYCATGKSSQWGSLIFFFFFFFSSEFCQIKVGFQIFVKLKWVFRFLSN